jgi:hypothetical protein
MAAMGAEGSAGVDGDEQVAAGVGASGGADSATFTAIIVRSASVSRSREGGANLEAPATSW